MKEIEFSEYDLLKYIPTGDEWCLTHDGKKVMAFHDAGSITSSGWNGCTMLVGTEAELLAEIKRLGLQDIDYEEN